MAVQNRFNLLDEKWIPIADQGRVSLLDVFSDTSLKRLGGNPIQKISIMKLLLAIGQAAATPTDFDDWKKMGIEGFQNKVITYLERFRDRFFLYGEAPFLQMPAIVKAKEKSFGTVLPEIATGNTTVLTQTQIEHEMDDGAKALLLVQLGPFSLSGKKTDNTVVLSPGYTGKQNEKGKASSGKAGPGVSFMGHLHSFIMADTIIKSIFINLFTEKDLIEIKLYPEGVGVAPWEEMPKGESCNIAKKLKNSLIGRLVPLSRFILFVDSGMHLSEGISHVDYKGGKFDPSIFVDYSKNKPRSMWTEPQKRPWRSVTALLSFLSEAERKDSVVYQLKFSFPKAKQLCKFFSIWSAGLKVSSNAGEQYCSGDDDFVDSFVDLATSEINKIWFADLEIELNELERISRTLYGRVLSYFSDQNMDGADIAKNATSKFWELCETVFQSLVDSCGNSDELAVLRKRYADFVMQCYNASCPKDTARQIDAWARNRPMLGGYITGRDAKTKVKGD